jgi:hypothetical protein
LRIDIKDRPGDGELSGEVIFPAPPLVLTLGLERATEPLLSFGGGSPTLSSRSRD